VNLGEASIVLRHRPPLEVVDLTLRFVRGVAPKQFLKLGAFFLLPAWGLCLLARWADFEWPAIWLGALLLARLIELPFTVLCGQLLFEPEARVADVVRDSAGAFFRLGWALILYGMVMSMSLILIIGPLFVGANYFFLPEVIILERSGPLKAFKRSHQFLGGRSGTGMEGLLLRTGMLVSFIVLTETLGQAIIEHILAIHAPLETLWEDGGSPLALLGLFAFVPYGAAHRFLSYTNERTRQDGWDIQVAFLRLAADADPTHSEKSSRAA
jgi:hypothetical protein